MLYEYQEKFIQYIYIFFFDGISANTEKSSFKYHIESTSGYNYLNTRIPNTVLLKKNNATIDLLFEHTMAVATVKNRTKLESLTVSKSIFF